MHNIDPSSANSRPVAVLYQSQLLHDHLVQVLIETGARVVYSSSIKALDLDALTNSGAKAIVVNLDAEHEVNFDDLNDFLSRSGLPVVFNDADVSSRLQGWDRARWSRHLAAKILGGDALNPPMPPNARPIPVPYFVKQEIDDEPKINFDLQRTALEQALAADTKESLARTRAALTTHEEPIAVQRENHFSHKQYSSNHSIKEVSGGGNVEQDVTPQDASSTEEGNLIAPDNSSAPLSLANLEQELISWHAQSEDISLKEEKYTDQSNAIKDGTESVFENLGADVADERLTDRSDFESLLASVSQDDDGSDQVDSAENIVLDDTEIHLNDSEFNFDSLDFEPVQGEQHESMRLGSDPSPALGLDDVLKGLAEVSTHFHSVSTGAEKKQETTPPAINVKKEQSDAGSKNGSTRDVSQIDLSHLSLMPLEEDLPFISNKDQQKNVEESVKSPIKDFDDAKFQSDFSASLTLVDYDDDEAVPESKKQQDHLTVKKIKEKATIKRAWVLGGSIGAPEAIKEFCSAIPADVPCLFVLAQHMGEDFFEMLTQQLAKATSLKVAPARQGDRVTHGQVIVVPLAERVLITPQGEVALSENLNVYEHAPSIDQVIRDVADQFGEAAGVILFSGMSHDGVEGAQYLHERGGKVWIQDPSTCVIDTMVEAAKEAGVVQFSASPLELAKKFLGEFGVPSLNSK